VYDSLILKDKMANSPVYPIFSAKSANFSNVNQLSMLKRLLFSIICVFTIAQQTSEAQCPGAFDCNAAEVICSIDALNGFTCNNPVTPNAGFPLPNLCFGVGVPHNLNWWAFIGAGGVLSLTFNFNPAGCEDGQGIQAGVFTGNCTGANVWDCNASCNTSTFTLTGATSACEVYYVWVDGCNGDVCTYTMSVNGNGGAPMLPPLNPLMTNDRVCPCGEFEVCAPNLGDCEPTYQWTVDGVLQGGRDECVTVMVNEFANPGDRIRVCLIATIGNPDVPGGICDQDMVCTDFIIEPIDMDIEPCEVVCFEDQPVIWHNFPILSSCIVPPCSTRTEGPDGCCVDVLKSWVILPSPGRGLKDTFICNTGIPYIDENGRPHPDEVCGDPIEFQRRVVHPACPTSIQMCDTTYDLYIGRFKYTSDPEFDCAACSGMVTVTANVEYDPDCPQYLGQVSIMLNWYNALTGDQLGRTDGLGSIMVPEAGRYCYDVEGQYRGITCFGLTPGCIEVPEDLFPDDPPISGDSVICSERYTYFETEDFPDRCDFRWMVSSGGGVITTPNSLDSSRIRVDWANRTGNEGIVCLRVTSDCGTRDSCYTLLFQSAPNPDAGPDQIVCALTTSFEGVPDIGGGMWTQVSGPMMADIVAPSDPTSVVSVDDYGTYGFIWTEQNLDCSGTDTVEILFAPDPEFSNIDTICSGDATEFTIRFDITRGTRPFTITQGAGQIVDDTVFVSNTIPDNTPTTITIQDDNGCEFTYVVDHDCVCANAPGEMATDTIKNCGPDEEICGIYDPTNMVLEPGKDTFMYILYTTVGDIQGTELARNHDGCFDFIPGTMMMDRVYYIGVVVGRKGNDGDVDFNGGCVQPAEAQPVIWYTIPTPDAGLDTAICGQIINLDGTISLNGTTYRWLNTAGANITSSGDLQTSVNVTDFGTYEFILEEVNAICPNTDTVAITFNESPEAINIMPDCIDPDNFRYQVCFEISGGTGPYRIVSGGGTITNGNSYCSDSLDSEVNYTIVVEDANGCQFTLPVVYNCDCGDTEVGTMDTTRLEACVDQCIDVTSNMTEMLQPDEEAYFVLHEGSGPFIQNEVRRVLYDHTANPAEVVTFCFDASAGMVTNRTYYVSRMVHEIGNADDACIRISPGQPLIWFDYPTADPGADEDVCGLEGMLSATPSLGTGQWTLVNSPAGSNAIFGANMAQGMVTVDMYGSYTFRWSEDNQGCTDSDDVTLTFHDAPNVTIIEFICDDVAENYTVVFEVRDGEQATWDISGVNATDLGNGRYESDPIPTGTSVNFCVTDQWDCAPACIDTSNVCECITEPGVVVADDALCIDECVDAEYQGGVIDPNDIIRFILHDGGVNNIGNILDCNETGEFCFDQFAMTANTTYYITGVAGNAGSNGCVDQNERCAVETEGIPVTWYEYPSPDIDQSEPQFTCQIDSMQLDGSASTGPGAISYTWRPLTGVICPSSDLNSQSVFICSPGSYILTVVHDISGCATSDTIEIGADENIPNVTAGNDLELTCDQTSVLLDGTGTDTGNDLELEWINVATNQVIGNGLTVTVTEPGTYRLTVRNSITDCDDFDEVEVTENVDQPTANIDQMGQLTCVIKEIQLEGLTSNTQGGVREYDWSTQDGEIVGSTTGGTITIGDPGTYSLIITDERNGCKDTTDITVIEIGNTLAEWDVTPTPPMCFGESNGMVDVVGIAGGDEPKEYSFNGGPFGAATQFNNLSAGTYNLVVRDANGCEKDTVIVVPETPDIGIQAKDDLFKEAGEQVNLDTLILSTFGVLPQDADSILWYDNETGDYMGMYPNSIEIDSLNRRYTFRVELWKNGCSKSDLITIFVKFTKRVYIPNVIIPGSNNPENKYLTIHGNKDRIKEIRFLRVYDRWGELIYSMDDVPYSEPDGRSTEGWDGRFNGELLNPAVFVYHTQIEFFGGAVEDYYGDVTLIRSVD